MEQNDWRLGPKIGMNENCPWRKQYVYDDEDQPAVSAEERLNYPIRRYDEAVPAEYRVYAVMEEV